jgi:AAA+ superfamily predicted ATPase
MVHDARRWLAAMFLTFLDGLAPSPLAARPALAAGAGVEPAALAAEMAVRRRQTPDLPVERLSRQFHVSPLESDILLCLLATEVDGGLLQACACLHDDPSRRWLTPGLLWRLLGLDPSSPKALAPFAPGSPLLQHRLVLAPAQINHYPVPLLERPLKLDDRIVAFLLGADALDAALAGVVELVRTGVADGMPAVPPELLSHFSHLLAWWRQAASPPLLLVGRRGAGKTAAARYLAAALCRPLLIAAASQLTPDFWFALRREADLRGALIYLQGFELVPDPEVWWPRLGEGVIAGATGELTARLAPAPFVVHFPLPDYEVRHTLWRQSLNGQGHTLDLADLAGQFRFTPGQILEATQVARQEAWLQHGPEAAPTRAELLAGARGQSNPALSRLATRVEATYDWDDLVLPPAQMAQLRAIVGQQRHAAQVYDSWGFGRKLPYGRGLAALFSGPSGTGKTMSATILARALGLDLYKIDLAGVVSKYIGETEKNLDRIFEEARTANIVLFFDEADALFGKRSEVKDAHDRYANIEISYLLQKMEGYEGVSILATNFSQNLDEAFGRRMQFVVEFPLPDAADRERIWRGLLPAEAPVAADADFAFLARRFELTGGHIKNCVVAAAFAAAARQEAIGMAHLVRAVAAEFGKLGRPLQRAAFGDYYALARQYG